MERERVREDRSLLMYVLLSLATCGIYGLWFYWHFYKDINTVCRVKEKDDSQNTPNYLIVVLLIFVTCGIYSFFWLYKQGNRIQRVGEAYGERIEENGTTYLMWTLLGSIVCGIGAIMATYLQFKNMNTLSRCYNREYIDGGDGPDGYDRYDRQSEMNREMDREVKRDVKSEQKQKKLSLSSKKNDSHAATGHDDLSTQGATVGVKWGTLVCTKGSLDGAQIPVHDGEVITIGRDGAACNLVLPDMDVSRRHCTVQFSAAEDCYYVTDYSSTGTILDGIQALKKSTMTKCRKGSRILLGSGNNEFFLQ